MPELRRNGLWRHRSDSLNVFFYLLYQDFEATGVCWPDGITCCVGEDSTDECRVWGHDPCDYASLGRG